MNYEFLSSKLNKKFLLNHPKIGLKDNDLIILSSSDFENQTCSMIDSLSDRSCSLSISQNKKSSTSIKMDRSKIKELEK